MLKIFAQEHAEQTKLIILHFRLTMSSNRRLYRHQHSQAPRDADFSSDSDSNLSDTAESSGNQTSKYKKAVIEKVYLIHTHS